MVVRVLWWKSEIACIHAEIVRVSDVFEDRPEDHIRPFAALCQRVLAGFHSYLRFFQAFVLF